MPQRRIRVLIVDDSALARKVLASHLAADPEIEVVDTAVDAYAARDKILELNPDVLTLDIEMPRLDGLSFLKLLMKHRPMPVIVVSSLTRDNSTKVLEAFQAGALEVVPKPGGPSSTASDGHLLAAKIKAAFQAKLRLPSARPEFLARPHTGPPSAPCTSPMSGRSNPSPADSLNAADHSHLQSGPPRQYGNNQVILMGASTGGTEALRDVLTNLSGSLPGICVVQHIPAQFSAAFADRLNSQCALEVREAQQGDKVQPGLVLVAPGGQHLVLRRGRGNLFVELNNGPLVHHQRPSVDILFDSAVRAGAGPHVLAVLLTGMGSDGATGMLKLKDAGATTVAQDEASCVVFGMPREAIRLGGAQHILSLEQMAPFIERYASDVSVQSP